MVDSKVEETRTVIRVMHSGKQIGRSKYTIHLSLLRELAP